MNGLVFFSDNARVGCPRPDTKRCAVGTLTVSPTCGACKRLEQVESTCTFSFCSVVDIAPGADMLFMIYRAWKAAGLHFVFCLILIPITQEFFYVWHVLLWILERFLGFFVHRSGVKWYSRNHLFSILLKSKTSYIEPGHWVSKRDIW